MRFVLLFRLFIPHLMQDLSIQMPAYDYHHEDSDEGSVKIEEEYKADLGKSNASLSQNKHCTPASMLKLCEVSLFCCGLCGER
jgi:hypothetical protein